MTHKITTSLVFVIAFGLFMVGLLMFSNTANAASLQEKLVKDASNTVYVIFTDSELDETFRFAFTSYGALESYSYWENEFIFSISEEELAFPVFDYMPPRNGSLFCATETKGTDVAGECSLITQGQKAAFPSLEVMQSYGYDLSKAFYGDSSFLPSTDIVSDPSVKHKPGSLLNFDGNYGYVLSSNVYLPVPVTLLASWGWGESDAVIANQQDQLLIDYVSILQRERGVTDIISFVPEDDLEVLVVMHHSLNATLPEAIPDQNQTDREFIQQIFEKTKNYSIEQLIPYMDSKSQRVFLGLPLATARLDADSLTERLPGSDVELIDSTILNTGDRATVSYRIIQSLTGYRMDLIGHLVKVGTDWQVDYLTTLNQQFTDILSQEPVTGLGLTDLQLLDAKVTSLAFDDNENFAEVEIKNVGTTTVNAYMLSVEINGLSILTEDESTKYYSLAPCQQILIRVKLIDITDLELESMYHDILFSVTDLLGKDNNLSNNSKLIKHYIE
ncbi:MAG TPA: hypothetical protein PKD79_01530 [Candidatus Doudnabacteria bacterium]|nr:hypothetical protein [Candidatus Doudnabacteria bacterium]